MRSALLILISAPVAVFLQTTLLANALPGGVTLNLALLLGLAGGFLWGAAGGALAGMWSGALVGAAAGSLAAPLSLLYALVGWLAGLHAERSPASWTFPLAVLALFTVTLSLESILEAHQPRVPHTLASLFWHAAAGLVFFSLPRKRGLASTRS